MSTNSFIENYPYHVVEFISPGRRPQVRKVDVVATKWMSFNRLNKKCCVHYPPPPYTADTYEKLNWALDDLSDVPDNWKSYTVKIRGKARTLEEALKKLEVLKEKESCLTLSSDGNLSDTEMKAVEQIRKSELKASANSFENLIKIHKADGSKSTHLAKSVTPLQRSISMQQTSLSGCSLPLTDVTNSTLNMKRASSTFQLQNDLLSIRRDKHNLPELENIASFSQEDCVPESSLAGDTDSPRKLSPSNFCKNSIPKSVKVNFQQTLLDYMSTIMADVKEIKTEIKSINHKITNIELMVTKTNVPKEYIGTVQQICDKFNYKIPFVSIEEFQKFDNDLRKNTTLNDAVANALQTGLDASFVISRSIVNMLKMFLSKDVACKYVAVKNVKGKHIMKTTAFFTCIEVIIKERRSISKLDTNDKEIISALSAVLSNSTTWYTSKQKQDCPETSNVLETIFVDPNQIQSDENMQQIITVLATEPLKKVQRLEDNEIYTDYELGYITDNSKEDSEEEFDNNYYSQLNDF